MRILYTKDPVGSSGPWTPDYPTRALSSFCEGRCISRMSRCSKGEAAGKRYRGKKGARPGHEMDHVESRADDGFMSSVTPIQCEAKPK